MKSILHSLGIAALLVALVPTASAQVTLTASASTMAVPQGGQVTFDYQVCNDRPETITGGLYYKVAGPVAVGLVLVQPGSVASGACSPNLSFTLNVPGSAPTGNYVVRLEARFNPGTSPVAGQSFDVQVTPAARPTGSATGWSVVDVAPWPELEAMRGGIVDITASADTESVAPGGQVTFTYQVCNNDEIERSGSVFYRVLRLPSGTPVTDETVVVSGSLAAMTCTPDRSFTVNVPGAAPAGNYRVRIGAGPAPGSPAANAFVEIEVTPAARLAGSATDWSLVSSEAWPSLEAAATTVPVGLGAYPNPFSRQTTLAFTLDEAADVRLAVYDVLGREVAVLSDGPREAGAFEVGFEAVDLPSGVYMVRLVAGSVVETVSVTLVR